MKAVAFSNNDIAIIAWTFGGRLQNCLGFAVYRIDVKAGTETCLPAMATFPGQQPTPDRTTANDPVQKFYWKDVYAKRGGSYRYRIVPMTGVPGSLHPMPYGPLVSNIVQLTPEHGALSAYFNRGILATQATAHQLGDAPDIGGMKAELLRRIADPKDQLRLDLAGDMIAAVTMLPKEAAATGGALSCALYEFEDEELIAALAAVGRNASLILSNMPGKVDGKATDDTYASEREEIKRSGVKVIDRFMPSGHIGHNKFAVLEKNGPQAVLFGSTNWTSRALCAQTNNSIVARSPKLAAAYLAYWRLLQADTSAGTGRTTAHQGPALRTADANGGAPHSIDLEDGSGAVDLWFSPNTPKARAASKSRGEEACPPDLAEVFKIIAGAKQAILFLEFEPGEPSVIDAIGKAQKANPALFVRGAVTVAKAANDFHTAVTGGAASASHPAQSIGDTTIPGDYRVIAASGVTNKDKFGQWEQELNSAGFAIIHDKIVVVDPFSDGCVVVTGSHNQGYQASYNNDENLAIIRRQRSLAEAYAAHVLDVYDHYAWRWWLARNASEAWTSLKADDSWQDAYFDADNRPKSAELNFWLASDPASAALPSPAQGAASTRVRPALQEIANRAAGAPAPGTAPSHGRNRLKREKTTVL